ncbi:hypothetical protein HPB48_010742 [Haemaphysalis longicornis]|uniref:Uncharacterized protein n=1 Tax=Haemaphysalis longicornis TaxID=44386 RepID=A0A9J6GBS7_HAELO|nr:hypothetical protein HPB48_010742 [Haemaphysalis longicornis]
MDIPLVNCPSVKNKADDLTSLLSSLNTDIVLGCESWLEESISNSEVFPLEYEAYLKDRNSRGGGVFILVKKTIPSFPIDLSNKQRISMVRGRASEWRKPYDSSVLSPAQ